MSTAKPIQPLFEPCPLGEACACVRVGRAFRWVKQCPDPGAEPSMAPQIQRAWLLFIPLGLSLGLAYGLDRAFSEFGAFLGVIFGLAIGFFLLRYGRF